MVHSLGNRKDRFLTIRLNREVANVVGYIPDRDIEYFLRANSLIGNLEIQHACLTFRSLLIYGSRPPLKGNTKSRFLARRLLARRPKSQSIEEHLYDLCISVLASEQYHLLGPISNQANISLLEHLLYEATRGQLFLTEHYHKLYPKEIAIINLTRQLRDSGIH